MARSSWNSMAALVAVVGLCGSSGLLSAQTPAAPADRYVTVGVGNDKVRCKVIQSWPLPNGGLAYQVRAVESGDLITVVRNGAIPGGRETPVIVYRWRDPNTSPVGAPVPPTMAPNDDAATAARKNAAADEAGARPAVKVPEPVIVPPTIVDELQTREAAAAPTIVNGPKGAIQPAIAVNPEHIAMVREHVKIARQTPAAETTMISPAMASETIVIAANQLPPQPAPPVLPESIMMPQPQMPVEIRPAPPALTPPGQATELTAPSLSPVPPAVAAPLNLPMPRPAIAKTPVPLPPPLEASLPPRRSSESLQAELPKSRTDIKPPPSIVRQTPQFKTETITTTTAPVDPTLVIEPRRVVEAPRVDKWPVPSAPVQKWEPTPRAIQTATVAPMPAPVQRVPQQVGPRVTPPAAGFDRTRTSISAAPVAAPMAVPKYASTKDTIVEVNESGVPAGPRVTPSAAGFDRTRTSFSAAPVAARMAEPMPVPKYASTKDTIVEVNESGLPVAETTPYANKKIPAGGNRPTTIMGMVDGFRGTRPAAPKNPYEWQMNEPAPTTAAYPPRMNAAGETVVTTADRRPNYADQTPTVVKKSNASLKSSTNIVGQMGGNRPATAGPNHANETIVLVEGKLPNGDTTPVVQKKPPMPFNRTTTLATMIAANNDPSAAPIAAPQTMTPRVVDGSFDRTRVSISPDQLAASHSAPPATTNPIPDRIVEISSDTPIVQKKPTPATGSLFNLTGKNAMEHPREMSAPTSAALSAEMNPFEPKSSDAKPQQPNAFTPAPQTQPRPPMTAGGIVATPIYSPPVYMPAMPPAYVAAPQQLPPVNPVQHSAPPKVALTGPANPAMDRPGTVPVAGEVRALAQFMQTAKESMQPSQRELAVLGMSNYDGRVHPHAVEFLKNLAVTDPAPSVRAAAVNALSRMNAAPQAVSSTLDTLRTDTDTRVRHAVEEATTAFGLGNR